MLSVGCLLDPSGHTKPPTESVQVATSAAALPPTVNSRTSGMSNEATCCSLGIRFHG